MVNPVVLELADVFLKNQWRLCTAESCTGGLVAASITALAGSSDWFERGYVTYSNEAKSQDIGVEAQLIQQHGAVSEAVAQAMAKGAKQSSGADVALSITGIAGPTGGSVENPLAQFGLHGHFMMSALFLKRKYSQVIVKRFAHKLVITA